MMYPRLLIISNEGFSKTSSNGRTLANLLAGWPKAQLAQFCLIDENPDFDTCENIFQVSDGQALRALFGRAEGGVLHPEAGSAPMGSVDSAAGLRSSLPRNTLTMLARDFVWSTGRWKRCGFDKWVADFAPQLVLLQAGDTGFMLELAMQVAKQYRIPLAVYNSENYYFKDFNYFQDSGLSAALYGFFHRRFQRQMRRLMEQGDCFLYLCDKLTRMYAAEFGREGHTVYTPASVIRHGQAKTGAFRTAYLGNLGLGRHLALIEFASVLREIDPSLSLDVYGNATEEIKSAFAACDTIRFHGLVPYETVQQVMADSSLLIHVEGKDPFTVKDLEAGFSTKIADCLGSGTPLLLYAPPTIACSEYVQEQKCAFYASDPDTLQSALRAAMDPKQTQTILDRAYEVACENHDSQKTTKSVQALLCGLVK